jgi:hypothetical protein
MLFEIEMMNLVITMNEVQIDITDITVRYQSFYTDDQTVSKAYGQLEINYVTTFQKKYETQGKILINEGDQDTHDHIENLTINDLKFIIANRLGVYKESGDEHAESD